MPIKFRCPECDTGYSTRDDLAGVLVRCKKCDSEVRVPSPLPPPQKVVVDATTDYLPNGSDSGYRCPFCQSRRPAQPSSRWPGWRILLVAGVFIFLTPVVILAVLAILGGLGFIGFDPVNDSYGPEYFLTFLFGVGILLFSALIALVAILLGPASKRLCPDCGQRVS